MPGDIGGPRYGGNQTLESHMQLMHPFEHPWCTLDHKVSLLGISLAWLGSAAAL